MPAPWVSYWSLLLSEDKSLASCTSTRMTGNLQLGEKTACRSTWSEGAAASKPTSSGPHCGDRRRACGPARIIFTLQYFDLLTHGLARLSK
jgi:hypothetical protein